MKRLINHSVIFWDFDGVIMDSMPIRDRGFSEVLKSYPTDEVEKLMIYHRKNGGLSRYVKFRYFFENIRTENVTEKRIMELADEFSKIMLSLLINETLLINDSLSFIKENYNNYDMHIVSGSDGIELNQICHALNLSRYFKSINGSPTPKIDLVYNLLNKFKYKKESVALIGDSKNDFDAAIVNGILFFGYNNEKLKEITSNYIDNFS